MLDEITVLVQNIKKDIISTRNRILYDANKELLFLYFRIGKTISENQKYGNSFIQTLSKALKVDFPDATGYSPRNLARMRKFYETYRDISNLPTALAKLPWSFNCLLIDKMEEIKKREWYASECLENGWTYKLLNYQIDSMLYEKQADNFKKLTNFATTIGKIEGENAMNIIKDPYIFELTGLSKYANEHGVEKAMVERLKTILLELGKGFSFVGNQYRISTETKDYYIDLLFYHLILRCFVVVELKNSDFDPSFIGQLQFYVTAVDETIKRDDDNQTIGLLLCKNKDAYTVDWSLKASSVPIGVASYEIDKYLPTEKEINCLWKK